MLFVDDDEQLLSAMARTVPAPVRLLTATNGAQARAFAERTRIEIAMVDEGLVGESGLDLIQWLRLRHSGIWITLVSADLQPDTVRDAIFLGADDCLEKPFRLSQVRERLKQIVADRRAASGIQTLAQVEWTHVQRALRAYGHNKTAAAKALGISLNGLRAKLSKGGPR
jgi:ActR/RegA family two-component response regulator